MYKVKNYSISLLLIFILILFFLINDKSFAQIPILDNFLNTTSDTISSNSGSIDLSIENKVKVCKDSVCLNTKSGFIYFKTSNKSSITIDEKKGIEGEVWGNELGIINFQPPYGGVFFADPSTGLLKGTAWSETSGSINFSVTGQRVIIDPNTGEFNGWAWASGPYGGWIKFDCSQEDSCVRTTWRYKKEVQKDTKIQNPKNKIQKINNNINKKNFNKIIGNTYKLLFSNIRIFFTKVGVISQNEVKTIGNTYKSLFLKVGVLAQDEIYRIGTTYKTLFSKTEILIRKTGEYITNSYKSIISSIGR